MERKRKGARDANQRRMLVRMTCENSGFSAPEKFCRDKPEYTTPLNLFVCAP